MPAWQWSLALVLPLSSSAVLNCTDVAQLTYDPIARPCCRAQKAWDQLVADGGCGGPDGAGPSQGNCDAALELCMDCEAAVQYYAQNATALGTRNVSVDISSTRVTCELPQWDPSNCVKGFGVGLLITTGVSLLVVASLACIAFDWRLLPSLVARQRRKLLVDAITVQNQIHAELDGCASPSAPPKPKPVPPAPPTPTARPQGFANAANECALRAAASVANVAAGTGTAELTLAELAASPTSPALDAAFAACGALVEEAPEPAPKAGPCRPRHYASAYALHGAFLVIACLAVLLRVSYVVCRGLLVVGLRSAHQCLPELLLCILPFAWVTCTSRRPKSSTSAVPKSIAYWGPWQAIPRFTTYAVCTICTEIYSTLVAALAVARLPCNASPLAGVLLYCVGLLVAVVRAYCCVLALRLQDELASVCRPATAPASTTEGAAGMTTARCPVAGANGAWDAPEGQRENQEKTGSRATSWRRAKSYVTPFCRRLCSGTEVTSVRDFNAPDPAAAALICPFLPDFVCPVLRRRLVGRRLLAGGIVLTLLSACVSAFVIKALLGEQEVPEEQLSSCAATQNGTSTCVAWQLAGVNLTDPQTGERKMKAARTLSDCCRGCDEVKGCQGWIFTHLDRRCRWLYFVDEVCHANPGDMSCRCLTSRGIAFSFKPRKKTHLILVDSNWE